MKFNEIYNIKQNLDIEYDKCTNVQIVRFY